MMPCTPSRLVHAGPDNEASSDWFLVAHSVRRLDRAQAVLSPTAGGFEFDQREGPLKPPPPCLTPSGPARAVQAPGTNAAIALAELASSRGAGREPHRPSVGSRSRHTKASRSSLQPPTDRTPRRNSAGAGLRGAWRAGIRAPGRRACDPRRRSSFLARRLGCRVYDQRLALSRRRKY